MATTFTNPLDSIKVASPCSADWDSMIGNNRQRHCGDCKLDVYNFSGMTKQEAENLIMNSEGRVCARFYRRKDGTVITKDCPVGWQAVKQRMSKMWTAVASIVITAIGGIGITAFMSQTDESIITRKITVKKLIDDRVFNMGNVPVYRHNSTISEIKGEIINEINEEPELIMGDIAEPDDPPIVGQIVTPNK